MKSEKPRVKIDCRKMGTHDLLTLAKLLRHISVALVRKGHKVRIQKSSK